MKLLADIAYETAPDIIDKQIIGGSKSREEKLEEWGRLIIERLKREGYYINKVKGDPSGRW
jgi:hypothetical protein